ncbi:PhzF family phenazine biosynthesis protein [Pacificimonas flava]|uniref:PhzF family phenazine biosynthesis protein n=2 Tax=Pacificimonas TaxID=1960290 RepID=A0A219B0D0_9SPHN|nr:MULTISPECIES: PhzF family phenazine biosynthesis protein [Pacificimonas]MBZ6379720.1 PhzF family phenazine biosynthesis protein [Pacificimonas aurantium]OWV31822.1 PhzF family phenazine biosynthesis protein [Pacificimonas flava]
MSHRARFRHIDAFAKVPFEGNSAAIYRVEAFPDDALMQRIAREHNLSETAWYVPDETGEADYVLRWFTPAVEVELCGHATLAAGHHCLTDEPERDAVRFRTLKGAGVLEVRRADDGRYVMSLPAWVSVKQMKTDLVAALGRIPEEVRVTTDAAEDSFMAVFGDEETVRALAPDFKALAAIGNVLVIATAPAAGGSEVDVVSRVFVPGAGVDEDPVTGSAHAMLTPYWAERLGRDSFEAFQASERGGRLSCRLEGDRVILGGSCVDVIEGDLLLP